MLGVGWGWVGGGEEGEIHTCMCFAEVMCVSLKFKTSFLSSHWCFLAFSLIPESGFRCCRRFWILVFSIFLALSDPSLPRARGHAFP